MQCGGVEYPGPMGMNTALISDESGGGGMHGVMKPRMPSLFEGVRLEANWVASLLVARLMVTR